MYVPFACKIFNSAKLAPLQEYQNVNTITFGSTFIDSFQLINNYQENSSINQNNKDLNSITNSFHQEELDQEKLSFPLSTMTPASTPNPLSNSNSSYSISRSNQSNYLISNRLAIAKKSKSAIDLSLKNSKILNSNLIPIVKTQRQRKKLKSADVNYEPGTDLNASLSPYSKSMAGNRQSKLFRVKREGVKSQNGSRNELNIGANGY